MPAPNSSTEFVDLLRKSRLFRADDLDRRLQALGPRPDDPKELAAVLVAAGLLTSFQAERLLEGKHRGFRLGAYLIRDQIARGTLGAIYLAEHESLRRRVAIKVLVPGGSVTPAAIERFLQESRATATLDHTNIIHLHEVQSAIEPFYLVMEYVEGQTLAQLLEQNGPLPYTQAAEYIAQAAAGLQHAHEKKFVHRDVKPSNLMLSNDGVVKILDLGIARSSFDIRDNLTAALHQDRIVGAVDIIAPEQASPDAVPDIRGDVYSLGATFFTLLTGRPPFLGTNSQKMLQHQITAPPKDPLVEAGVPAKLSQIILQMLAKRPEDRFETPGLVVAALKPWRPQTSLAKSAPVPPAPIPLDPPPPAPDSPPAPARKRIWPILLGLALVLLLVAILAAISLLLSASAATFPQKFTSPPTCDDATTTTTSTAP